MRLRRVVDVDVAWPGKWFGAVVSRGLVGQVPPAFFTTRNEAESYVAWRFGPARAEGEPRACDWRVEEFEVLP